MNRDFKTMKKRQLKKLYKSYFNSWRSCRHQGWTDLEQEFSQILDILESKLGMYRD